MHTMRAAVFLGPGRIVLDEDQIEQAYELFAHQRDGVLKVAITP